MENYYQKEWLLPRNGRNGGVEITGFLRWIRTTLKAQKVYPSEKPEFSTTKMLTLTNRTFQTRPVVFEQQKLPQLARASQ